MMTESERCLLANKVEELLFKVGLKVENERIVHLMKAQGCTQAPDGRVRIPKSVIAEFVSRQASTCEEDRKDQSLCRFYSIDWAHHIIWNGRRDEMLKRAGKDLLMSAFDCGPTKYYDYNLKKVRQVDTEVLIEMMKLAEVLPEVGYISTWYRSDIDPRVERVDSLVTSLKYTHKVDGIEAIHPEVIKYLKEASEIITDRPGDTSYLAGSECMSSPLILESRSAEDIIERARLNIQRYHVASMITVGVNAPITIASSALLGAAEILAGMVACWCVDPESDITGRMICSVVDMKNAYSVYSAPESTMVNIAVKEVFDAFWGGHLWTEVFFSPTSKLPGLQTVFECYAGASRYAYLAGERPVIYPGMGTLDNGAVGSPTQLMLDIEIRKAEFKARQDIVCDEQSIMYEDLCESIRSGGEFLTSDHTLEHYKEMWSSSIFRSDAPSASWPGDERGLLDLCDERWRETVKSYVPPLWPMEKMKELDRLVANVRKEMLQ